MQIDFVNKLLYILDGLRMTPLFHFSLNYSFNVFCVQGQEVFLEMCPPLEATRERMSSARSVSSQSSRKSSHTALSDSACEYKHTSANTLYL